MITFDTDASLKWCSTPPLWHIDAVGGRPPHHKRGNARFQGLRRTSQFKNDTSVCDPIRTWVGFECVELISPHSADRWRRYALLVSRVSLEHGWETLAERSTIHWSRTRGDRDMNKHLVSRRHFNTLCATLGLSLPSAGALDELLSASVLAADTPKHTVKFPDGTTVPAVGQGCWHLGQGRHPPAVEEEALRTGISLGMTLIDTSGNYGNGRSEQFISHVIAGQRDRIFLVSKVEANRSVWRWHRACLRGEPRSSRHRLSRSLFAALRQSPARNSPAWWRHSNNYARRERFALGAYPTSTLARWKICSAFQTAIAAPPIRSLTVSTTVALSVTFCHGASSTICR